MSRLCPKHTIAAVGHFISFCRDRDPVAVPTLQTNPGQGLVKPDRTEFATEVRSEMKLQGQESGVHQGKLLSSKKSACLIVPLL